LKSTTEAHFLFAVQEAISTHFRHCQTCFHFENLKQGHSIHKCPSEHMHKDV